MAGFKDKAVSLGDLRKYLRESLADKFGEREASAIAALILTTLKGWTFTQLLASEDREASDFVKNRALEILDQVSNDMPVQYALGQTSFYGLILKVGPGVLVPRPETEELVDLIVKENTEADLNVIDLCTGSGAIALALARNLPFSKVTAIDISNKALAYAEENNKALKTKIYIEKADIFSLSLPKDSFDIMVSNPPYVCDSEKSVMDANVLNYEPHEALFVPDADPLKFYKHIADLGRTSLVAGGRLYLEINPLHARELSRFLEEKGYRGVETVKDIHGKERFMKGVKL